MDDQFKKSIKKVLEHTEISMTRSLLRWKYKREGKAVPQETKLQADSRRVVGKANQVIAERGKNVWKEGDHVDKCSKCHPIVWKKGKKKKKGEAMKLQNAYHKNCKNCHKALAKKEKPTGPFKKCNGCHEKKKK